MEKEPKTITAEEYHKILVKRFQADLEAMCNRLMRDLYDCGYSTKPLNGSLEDENEKFKEIKETCKHHFRAKCTLEADKDNLYDCAQEFCLRLREVTSTRPNRKGVFVEIAEGDSDEPT